MTESDKEASVPESWRLISWNICRGGQEAAQVAALAKRDPAVVALQDVYPMAAPTFQAELEASGLPYHAYSLPDEVVPVTQPAFGQGRLRLAATLRTPKTGVLLASRWPLTLLDPAAHGIVLPWPERLIVADIMTSTGPVRVYTAYLPHAGQILALYHSLAGLLAGLQQPWPTPRILCGDLNCPLDELPDGRLVTHGQEVVDGEIVVRNRPMDVVEQALFHDLAAYDLVDVYRLLYGTTGSATSYQDTKPPYRRLRLDHVLASRALRPQTCLYLDSWHDSDRLSDHAAVEVTFQPPGLIPLAASSV